MSFLYDYGAAAAIAGVCSLLAWLFGGTVASALLPTIPWAIVIMAEFALCFPQRHSGETTYEARLRVWRAIRPVYCLSFSNLFNKHYASGGWVYSAVDEKEGFTPDHRYYQIGFIPMAGFTMMGNVTLRF